MHFVFRWLWITDCDAVTVVYLNWYFYDKLKTRFTEALICSGATFYNVVQEAFVLCLVLFGEDFVVIVVGFCVFLCLGFLYV